MSGDRIFNATAPLASSGRVVPHELHPHHLGDGLPGDVVLRGAEAAAHDHRLGAVEGLAQDGDDAALVVADLRLPQVLDPPTGWVQNCNDSPWTSVYPMAIDPKNFLPYIAPPPSLTQRAQRSIRLLSESGKISRHSWPRHRSVSAAQNACAPFVDR